MVLLAICAAEVPAQSPVEPAAYTVKSTNNMTGQVSTSETYRLGSKAVVDSITPAQGSSGAMRVHTWYDLDKRISYTWDPKNDSVSCAKGTFSGDWGDPFSGASGLVQQGAKTVGAETVNGFPSTILEVQMGDSGTLRAWVDKKTNMVAKAVLIPPGAAPLTMVEVKSVDLNPPPASIFTLPAKCAVAQPAASRLSDADQKIAEFTGGDPQQYEDGIYPAGSGSRDSCTVVFRVVKAATMEPITSGFQVALDMDISTEPEPHYRFGVGQKGHTTFSGGGLREVTAQIRNGVLRIENPPAKFHVETALGNGGQGSADIYRRCFGPETVLLYVIRNPANIMDGA
ncbi:MAG TPA: hypothetical protein VKB38_15505 [Terracidiphilus sp.]|nr:hypothetical protein [Terracidiphilus sp.]